MLAEAAFQVNRDSRGSAETRKRAEVDLRRVQAATERIKAMTRLYLERLDGRRADH